MTEASPIELKNSVRRKNSLDNQSLVVAEDCYLNSKLWADAFFPSLAGPAFLGSSQVC